MTAKLTFPEGLSPEGQERTLVTKRIKSASGDYINIVEESADTIVARIPVETSLSLFADQRTHTVIVAPGVDMALIAALCICLYTVSDATGGAIAGGVIPVAAGGFAMA